MLVIENEFINDHGDLDGLADDDHTQYSEIANAETITGLHNFIASGLGGLADYDITVGDVGTPDYGIIRIGDSIIGRTSYNAGSMDVDGAFVIRNEGTPATSNIEFFIAESGGNAIRFALAKSAVGNATYNPRSMIIAGPAVLNDEVVTVGYWQTNNNIFDNLTMDTVGSGADLGVQNDLEVEGDIFVDSIKESTSGAGVSFNDFNIKNVGDIALDTISPDAAGEIVVTDKLSFTQTDFNEYIDSLADGELDLEATTSVNIRINTTEQVQFFDGSIQPTTDNDIDLGGSSNEWKDLFVDGTANLDDVDIDGNVGIGLVPNINANLDIDKTHSATDQAQFGIRSFITQDTATGFTIAGIQSAGLSTHTSGTISTLTGYTSNVQAKSNGTVTSATGLLGQILHLDTVTPSISINQAFLASVTIEDISATFAIGFRANAVTVDTGSVTNVIGGFFREQTVGSNNWSIAAEGDVQINSNKKLILEGTVISGVKGDSYFVFNSATTDIDLFVDSTKVITFDNDFIASHVDFHFDDAQFIVFDKASGNGIKVDTATPTFGFADLLGDVTVKNTGGTRPALIAYRDGLLEFEFAPTEEEYFKYHIPHDYVKGTDIFLHFHWSVNGALVNGGTVTFDYEISYAKGHAQAAFPASVSGTVVSATASSTQYTHELTEVQISATAPSGSQIDSDDLEPDGVIICTAGLNANNLTVSSGGVPDPFIHYIDIHYQTTGLIGTKAKAPDFYA